MDARKLYKTVEVRWEEIQEGDFVRPKSWSRARRVELIEYRDGQRILLLADPDQETLREIDLDGFVSRAVMGRHQGNAEEVPVWFSLAMFRKLWDAAHF